VYFLKSVKESTRMDDLLDVEIQKSDVARAVVAFTGEHDLTQIRALGDLLSTLVAENELVVADFSRARFVDSSVINLLLDTRRLAVESQRRFRLQLGTACMVYRVFEVAGVLSVLECASSREEALGENLESRAED
jgi:anti-anti-sigma factor